jgi:hypothetical protein
MKIIRSRHLYLIERTNRSAYAFTFGDGGGSRMTFVPPLRISRRNLVSRSRMRYPFPRIAPLSKIDQIAPGLQHPRFIRSRRDSYARPSPPPAFMSCSTTYAVHRISCLMRSSLLCGEGRGLAQPRSAPSELKCDNRDSICRAVSDGPSQVDRLRSRASAQLRREQRSLGGVNDPYLPVARVRFLVKQHH